MAGADQYRHSSSKGNICRRVPKQPVQIPSFMSISTIVIELREEEEEEKQHGQNVKTIFTTNWKRKWYLSEVFHTQFVLTCSML